MMSGLIVWLLAICGFAFCTTNLVDDDTPGADAGGDDGGEDLGEDGDTDTDSENQDNADESKKGKDAIPYNRFKEVNDERKDYKSRAETAEAENALLKQKSVPKPAAEGKRFFEDPKAEKFVQDFVVPVVKEMVGEVKSEVTNMSESAKAEAHSRDIETAVDGFKSGKYKELDSTSVINEYILNPKANLEDLAKASHEKMTERDNKTKATYRKGKETDAEHKGGSPAGGGAAKDTSGDKKLNFNQRMALASKRTTESLKNYNKGNK